jgi:hypothetical protein
MHDEGRQVLTHYHQVTAENVLLKAQITGLQEALRQEKRAKQPKKTLYKEICGDDPNTGLWFTPSKIQSIRTTQARKKEEAKEAQAKKERKKAEREQRQRDQDIAKA